VKIKGLYHMPGSKYLWYRWSASGKRYAVSLKTSDLGDAITKIREISMNAERRMRLPAPPSQLDKLVSAYLSHAQNRRKKPMRPRTAKKKEYVLKKLLRDLGVKVVADLSVESICRWVDGLGGSDDTRHTYARDIMTFCRWLVRNHIASSDLLDFEIPVRSSHGRKNWVKGEVANRVSSNCKDPDLTFVLFCGFHCGLRKDEIVNTRVHWFDLDAGLLHVQNDPAGGFILNDRENRTIPLSKEFLEFLGGFLANRNPNEHAIRPHKIKGKGPYRYDFNKSFRTFMRRQDVRCTVHDMRRSFASNLVSHGISVYKVAKWLGDGLAVVDKSYGHLAPLDDDIHVLGASYVHISML
jgi:integrase